MSSDERLAMIREMERDGCELITRFHPSTGVYLLTIRYRGKEHTFPNIHRYAFRAAYDLWRVLKSEKAAA